MLPAACRNGANAQGRVIRAGDLQDDFESNEGSSMKRSTPTNEGREAEKALRTAVKKVIEENRRLGLPVAVMRNVLPLCWFPLAGCAPKEDSKQGDMFR